MSGIGTKRNCLSAHGTSGAEGRPAIPNPVTQYIAPQRGRHSQVDLCSYPGSTPGPA